MTDPTRKINASALRSYYEGKVESLKADKKWMLLEDKKQEIREIEDALEWDKKRDEALRRAYTEICTAPHVKRI